LEGILEEKRRRKRRRNNVREGKGRESLFQTPTTYWFP
jgi:hypothetical protein